MATLDQRRNEMIRRLGVHGALLVCFVTNALAQSGAPTQSGACRRAPQAQPTRPPIFFSEGWKALRTPPDEHGAWPASQAAVASSGLELQLHGPSAKEIQLVAVRGMTDLYPLNLWTGTTT